MEQRARRADLQSEAVERMTAQIIKANDGRVSPEQAKRTAVKAAVKHDRDKSNRGKK